METINKKKKNIKIKELTRSLNSKKDVFICPHILNHLTSNSRAFYATISSYISAMYPLIAIVKKQWFYFCSLLF